MQPEPSQASHDEVSEPSKADSASSQPIKQVDQSLFRQDAVDAYIKGAASEGTVFEAEPAWIKSTYTVLLIGVGALLLFIVLGRVHEYANGSVVVYLGNQQEITAVIDANIGSVLVSAGDKVEAGQAILQLYQAEAIADYERLKTEFELRLRQRLMEPDNSAVESALISLNADMVQAKNKIDQRLIHAEVSGTVGDVRIRAGQRVVAGQVLMSLTKGEDNASVIAFLPGKYRPQIKTGMQLQLTLDGYPYSIQYLDIDSIGDEIIGPAEARQFLGNVIADGMDIQGANFIVEAKLDSASFSNEGQVYDYHHGMHGVAEVKVLSEPILITLFPSFKKVFNP